MFILGSGLKCLCLRSPLSLLVSFLSTFAILALSCHLTSFALRTFSASPSALFSALCVELFLKGLFLGFWFPGTRGPFSSFGRFFPRGGDANYAFFIGTFLRLGRLPCVDVEDVCVDFLLWEPVLLFGVLVYLVLFTRNLPFEDREE